MEKRKTRYVDSKQNFHLKFAREKLIKDFLSLKLHIISKGNQKFMINTNYRGE